MVKADKKISEKLQLLPESEGVYLWKDSENEVIYVGKAKNLKNRIRSYFQTSVKDDKTAQLVSKICDLEYILTNSEAEAFILEASLIKKYRPKYNILLKDDKKYPFVKVTINEMFPRVFVTRDLIKDGSRYFGPYTDVRALKRILRMTEWVFPVRSCSRRISEDSKSRPCINHQLRKCTAPCACHISRKDYNRTITNLIRFLEGKHTEIISDLKSEMQVASDDMNYEAAARIRDKINEIERIQKRQSVFSSNQENLDVIGMYKEEDISVVVLMHVINGRLINKESYTLSHGRDFSDAEILTAFIKMYYSEKVGVYEEIIVPVIPYEIDELNKWLSNKIKKPHRGDKSKLLLMANRNAFHLLENELLSHLKKTARTVFPVKELKDRLSLKSLPRKIVCIDISTIQGEDTVSSAVFFSNGKPYKKFYRHYIIRNSLISNDYAAIEETTSRFLKEVLENADMLPDLIVIDGGKGQLNSALRILKKSNSCLAIISLAKRIEEVFLPDVQDSIILPKSSSALRLLIRIRDEAHRFAISFHRKRRSKRTLLSDLANIEGVGDNIKFILFKELGSIDKIKSATLEQLVSIKGIGKQTADKIIKHFNQMHS